VCQAIEQVRPLHANLKWPNDVVLNGRKAGGILVETTLQGQQLDYAIVGLGLNVNWSPAPTEVDFPATSLSTESGQTLDRLELLRAILMRMEALYPNLTRPALYHDWRARLLWLGEPIAVRTTEGELRGQAQNVDDDGTLVLLLDTGETRRVTAGDVRLRRGA
jgi:BirA family biotin operon repressor/biotin-[acetyl-CoA-carboxylase] ligase